MMPRVTNPEYPSTCTPTYFPLQCFQFLFFQAFFQLFPSNSLLFLGELGEGELLGEAVLGDHAQGAAPAAGHAGEALAALEVEHRHAIKLHIVPL